MKHQYFGDVNDYRKYGLLRRLATEGGLQLGISWMLTPDDDSRHGGKVDYLDQPRRWRSYDPDLFDHLAASVEIGRARDLSVVEANNLIPGARFHSDIIEDGKVARAAYMKTMHDRFKGLDLVFFDPDNGLDVKSCPLGRKGSSKYLTCQEAAATFATGASLLVFQHFAMVKKEPFTLEKVQRLADSTGAKVIIPISTAYVLFLLVLHPSHVSAAQRAIEALDMKWPGQFQR
jgi:hypothetical protein